MTITLIIIISIILCFFGLMAIAACIVSSFAQEVVITKEAPEIECAACGHKIDTDNVLIITKHNDDYQVICPACQNIITVHDRRA